MQIQIEDYLSQIKKLRFMPVSQKIWDVIQEEGLDKEFNVGKNHWYMTELNLSDEDKMGLESLVPETIEKFNDFDIKLKDQFDLKLIDLIDYENGIIIIVFHI